MTERLISSNSQLNTLVEFMERNGDIGQLGPSRPGIHSRLQHYTLWAELTDQLNSDKTGNQRATDRWKKVWSDLKNRSKKKAEMIKRLGSSGGYSPPRKIALLPLEKRTLSAIGVELDEDSDDLTFEITLPASLSPSQLSPPCATSFAEAAPARATPPRATFPQETQPRRPKYSTARSTPSPTLASPPRSPARRARGCGRESAAQRRRVRRLTPFERATQLFAQSEIRRRRRDEKMIKLLERLTVAVERIAVKRKA